MKLLQFIPILFYFSMCTALFESIKILYFIKKITFDDNKIPIRVRTVEERDRRSSEHVVLDFVGLVQQYQGYQAEEYTATTMDGYNLRLHRICVSPLSPKATGKPVVYIQHGLFGSSDFFVVLGPERSLALQLADKGYDVWLGNARGNTYSRSHKELSPSNDDFWDFSMDQIGSEDLSTSIDTILEKTGQSKLTYIGYSMGTTVSYILLASKPEYNEKINLLVSLAPAAYFQSESFYLNTMIFAILATAQSKELLPQSIAIQQLAKTTCANSDPSNLCASFFDYSTDINNMNLTSIPLILSHSPAGTSYNVVKHFSQLGKAGGKFLKYQPDTFRYSSDYSDESTTTEINVAEYDTSLITVPTVIFYCDSDVYVAKEDTEYLKTKLPNVVAFEKVPDAKFNHLDFIWSNKATDLVYNPLLKIITDRVPVKQN